MIKISNFRKNGGPEKLLSEYEEPIEKALKHLIGGELTYGGVMTDCSETHLEIQTRILHCEDRTVFSGSKEEVGNLLFATVEFHKANEAIDFEELVKKVEDVSHGNALLVTTSLPLIRGEMALKLLQKKLLS